ncbi:MAG: DUF6364 family protein [Fusobacteriaceae bacterium]|jgi:hypothetical protein|nr:DUF6364 family protein [Fusobacteriaceae bacterium]
MTKKLTLSLDPSVIDFAHNFSKKSSVSISKIVENYFRELMKPEPDDMKREVIAMCGILAGRNLPDKKQMRKIFHEDHID